MKKGIDVSEHQGVINWDVVRSHIDFAIIRAGYGRNNIDPQFVRNIRECNRLGIPCGIYWFSYALTVADAQREAQYCLNAIKDYKVEMPVAFDLEYDSADYAAKYGVTLTKVLATAMLTAFCEEIEKAGYFAMMYANADYLCNYYDEALAKRFALWFAYPTNVTDLSVPPSECGIWQHTFKGRINGINGDVDKNVAYKDYAAWIKELGLNHMGAPTTPEAPTKPAEPVVDKVEEAIKKLRAAGYDDVLIMLAALID